MFVSSPLPGGLLINEVIGYSSVLSVCEAAATWTMALRVLEDFEPDLFSSLGTKPSVRMNNFRRWELIGDWAGLWKRIYRILSSSMFQMLFLLTQNGFWGFIFARLVWYVGFNVAEVSTVQLARATKEDSSLWHVDCLIQCCKLLFYLTSPGNTVGSTTPSIHQQCLFEGLLFLKKITPSNTGGSNITLISGWKIHDFCFKPVFTVISFL